MHRTTVPLPVSAPLVAPRTVLVTGAAKRLGRAIALTLAAQGWRVAVHYRDSLEEARQTAADCAALTAGSTLFRANLANETAVRNLLGSVVAELGYVDAVVNCASTFEHDSPHTFSFAAMETHWRSNTAAPILLSQALHAHLLQRAIARNANANANASSNANDAGNGVANGPSDPPPGVVVNILDQKLWNPNPDFLSYTLSKAALEAANTMLAMAFSPVLRVVGVAPGLTLSSHMLKQEQFEALHKLSPMGRSSTPEDVAQTVLFALQNRSITGTTLLVDGGQHLMRFERDFSLM